MMKREHFVKVVEEALDSLPQEFRSRIKNVAILVEDFPPNQSPPQPGSNGDCFLASFTACQPPRRASLTYQQVQPTSCFTKTTSKPSVRARQKSPIKSAKHSCTNWDTISA